MGTTPRRGFPTPPEHGVTPDVPRDLATLVNMLDTPDGMAVAFDMEGPASARPDASSVPNGTYYFSTDTGRTERARSDGWHSVSGLQGHTGDLKASLQTADHGPWVLADGRTNLQRALYPDSFGALMDSYVALGRIPAAIDADHISVPDWTGRALIGAGAHADVAGLLKTDGLAAATRTPKHRSSVNEPNGGQGHAHGVTDPGHKHDLRSSPVSDGLPFESGTGAASSHQRETGPDPGSFTATNPTGITVNRTPTGVSVGPTDGSARPVDEVPFATANIFIYTGTSDADGGGVGTGVAPRDDTPQIVTAAIATGAEEAGAVELPRSTRFMRIGADRACRVRFYMTAADRDADAARLVGDDPPDDAGLIAEVVLTAALLDLRLSPQPIGSNFDNPVADQLYYRIRNDGAAGAVTVNLTIQRVE